MAIIGPDFYQVFYVFMEKVFDFLSLILLFLKYEH